MSVDLATLDEAALVRLSRAGDDRAFAEIMLRHRDALYRVALASLGDADDALDIVQEAFVSAHRALARFDSDRPLRPWLARIALNRCRDHARRRAVRRMLLPFMRDDHAEIADDAVAPDVAAADREALARTMRAVAALPAAIREPLVLRTIEGLSQAETASALGITAKAVEMRVRRAREKLSAALS